jgi:hypothetical protein
MKLKFIYTLFVLLSATVIFWGSSGGRADSAQQGNTGAPGDASSTCMNCHNGGPLQVSLNINVLDASGSSIASTGYTPGETYDVEVSLDATAGTPAGYGFQLLALNGEEGENAPQATDWSNPESNVKISTVNSTGRVYAEHNGVQNNNVFRVSWTAPTEGPVTFYSCGNGINGNGATSGDGAGCNTLTIQENQASSTTTPLALTELTLFPNPALSNLQLSLFSEYNEPATVVVTDMTGKQQLLQNLNLTNGENLFELDVQPLPAGHYFLNVQSAKGSLVKSFVKK